MKVNIFLLTAILLTGVQALAQPNRKPRITGQFPLSTNEDEKIIIRLTDLKVDDPDDWFYPLGFTLHIHPGKDYTFEGRVVTPAANFHGKLKVKVTVSDGHHQSNKFDLEITVKPVNDRPVITGHTVALTTNESEPVTIALDHLRVTDPDNEYPRDFSLRIRNGQHYTSNGNQVTPRSGFTGTLTVSVAVNDGETSSDNYALPVTVNAVNRAPTVTGQVPLHVAEDNAITVDLSHLYVVDDDDGRYPEGYTLTLGDGQHYSLSGKTVTPAGNFNGILAVPVTVSDGKNTSKPFVLSISVTPVDDAPIIKGLESEPVNYMVSNESATLTASLEVLELDDDSVVSAEIAITRTTYQANIDKLIFAESGEGNIRGTFDAGTGVLTLQGVASPGRYAAAIRTVQYQCLAPSRNAIKTIAIKVNDGHGDSETVTRDIAFGKVTVALDIPTGFTPNGDMTNDTWKIIPLKEEESYAQARVRVYNKQGIMVYESTGFDNEWDGRFQGELLPADTYFYTINLNILAPEGYLTGVVTILR